MPNSRRILFAYVAGQATQIVMSVIAKSMYVNKMILWTAAAGFLLAFALFVGVCIGGGEVKKRNTRKEKHHVGE